MGDNLYCITDLNEAMLTKVGFDYETAWVKVDPIRRVASLDFANILVIKVSTVDPIRRVALLDFANIRVVEVTIVRGYLGLSADCTHYYARRNADAENVWRIVCAVRAHIAATTTQSMWNPDPFRSRTQPAPGVRTSGSLGPSVGMSSDGKPLPMLRNETLIAPGAPFG